MAYIMVLNYLIEAVKGIAGFVVLCICLFAVYLVFVVVKETGWRIKQENRKWHREEKTPCDYCGEQRKKIEMEAVWARPSEMERIEIWGNYLWKKNRYFTNVEKAKIYYCPMCGRMLKEEKEDGNDEGAD